MRESSRRGVRGRRVLGVGVGIGVVVGVASAAQPPAISWDFDGDGHDDLIAGQPQHDYAVPLAGDAEIYSTQDQAQLGLVTSPDTDDLFGTSVASVGDIDGDGKADFAVGALASNFNTTDQIDSGRVIVYSGADQSVIHDLTVLDVKFLGRTVAGVGDVDGDGVPDIAAAGYGQTPMGGYVETVFVFSGSDGVLVREIESWWGDDTFGLAITGLGDVNADGIGDFAASAPFAATDDGSFVQGKVYIFLGEQRGPTATHAYTTSAFNEILSLDPDLTIGMSLLHGTDQNADDIAELLIVSRYASGPNQYLYLAESVDVTTGQRVVIGEPDPLGGHGDVDRDLDIDGDDLNALIVLFGLPVDPDDPFNGDFNGDGVVDAQDLNDVVAEYGHEHPLAELAHAEGELIAMTREIILSFAPGPGENCGRPMRSAMFPGAFVACNETPIGWTGGFESEGTGDGLCCGMQLPLCCWPQCGCGGDPTEPGAPPGGDPGTPNPPRGDADGDQIPDRMDCDFIAPGIPDTCCVVFEVIPGEWDWIQNLDQDGDCIPNGIDCNSACFMFNPATYCGCQDDDGDGEKNQNDCDSSCAAGSVTCFDLLTDVDGDGALTPSDEELEDVDDGMIIVASTLDSDIDAVPDYLDGFDWLGNAPPMVLDCDGCAFTPLALSVSGPCDEVEIEFTYSASDPLGMQVPAEVEHPSPAAGHLRIWTKDASEQRDPRSVLDGGDFVPAGTVPLAALPDSQLLFIEAVRESDDPGDLEIAACLSLGADCESCSVQCDVIKLTAVRIEILVRQDGGAPEPATGFYYTTLNDGSYEGLPDPGIIEGSWAMHRLVVHDPRADLTVVNIAGTPLQLTQSGDSWQSSEFAVVVPGATTSPGVPTLEIAPGVLGVGYNPEVKIKTSPKLKEIPSDLSEAAHGLLDVIHEMKDEGWNGEGYPDTDDGAFGTEAHKRLAAKLTVDPDWYSELYIRSDGSKEVLSIGSPPPDIDSELYKTVDLLRAKPGYTPTIGAPLDLTKVERVIEVKTSINLKIDPGQKAWYKALTNNDYWIMTGTERWVRNADGVGGTWKVDRRFAIKLVGFAKSKVSTGKVVAGAGGAATLVGVATTAWNMWHYSKYDPLWKQVVFEADKLRAQDGFNDKWGQTTIFVDTLRVYLSNFVADPTSLNLGNNLALYAAAVLIED